MSEFEQFVNNIESRTIHRIDEFFKGRIPDEYKEKLIKEIQNIATARGFTRQDFIKLIKENPGFFEQHTLEGSVPEIEIGEEDLWILDEIENKGPFKNPLQLSQAIADVIKKYMKYDFLTYLFSSQDIDKRLLQIDYISVESYEAFKEYLDIIIPQTEGLELRNALINFRGVIKNMDKDTFKKRVLNNINKKEFIIIIKYISRSFNKYYQYFDAKTVGNYFRMGVGDCKHFAAINQILYNKLAPKYFNDSKMLQVFIFGHTYNLLVYEDKFSGRIFKHYLDMTSYLSGGRLIIEKITNREFIIGKNDSQKEKGLS